MGARLAATLVMAVLVDIRLRGTCHKLKYIGMGEEKTRRKDG